jgi:hypothetical protein
VRNMFFSALLIATLPVSAQAYSYSCGGAQADDTHDFIELYDFKNEMTVQALIGNEGLAYQSRLTIEICNGTARRSTVFVIPDLELVPEICGSDFPVMINSYVSFDIQSSISGLVIDRENVDELAPGLWPWDTEGDLIIWSKWAGHGDQSQIISYQLYGDNLIATFGIVDNCSDQSQDFKARYIGKALP